MREKSGEGKTVRALTRMLVVGSSRVRCGLNWYLDHDGAWVSYGVYEEGGKFLKGGGRGVGSDRANSETSGAGD